MLKIECPSCQAPYQIDERRVPMAGLKMRCPRCGNSMLVLNPGDGGPARTTLVPAGPPLPVGRMRTPKPTMVGFAEPPPSSTNEVDLPAPRASVHEADLPAVFGGGAPDLPVVAGRSSMHEADLPVVAGARGPTSEGDREAGLPALAPRRSVTTEAELPVVASPRRSAVDDPSLPALSGRRITTEPGLPAVREPRRSQLAFDPADLPASASDLPARKETAELPARRVSRADLPALAADLPAPAAGLPAPAAALPARAPMPSRTTTQRPGAPGLAPPAATGAATAPAAASAAASGARAPAPSTSGRKPEKTMGFGDLELPLVFGNAAAARAPAPTAKARDPLSLPPPAAEPAAFDDFDPLALPEEMPEDGVETAPEADSLGGFELGGSLPEEPEPTPAASPASSFAFGELELDMAPAPSEPPRAPAPPQAAAPRAPATSGAHRTAETSSGAALGRAAMPSRESAPKESAPSFASMLDEELGRGAATRGGPEPRAFEAAPLAESRGRAPSAGNAASTGGMGFGEIDLGAALGDNDAVAEIETAIPTRTAPGSTARSAQGAAADLDDVLAAPDEGDGGEAALPDGIAMPDDAARASLGGEAALPTSAAKKAPKPQGSKNKARQKRARIALGVAAAVVLAGASLQLTELGAFGYLAISDAVHQKAYAAEVTASVSRARAAFATDDFNASKEAVDALAAGRARAPRNRALAAYATFAALAHEQRFGADPRASWNAASWVADIPEGAKVPYLTAARGLLAAQNGNTDQARQTLERAAQEVGSDPFGADVLLALGDMGLRAHDARGAAAAFERAATKGPSPRSRFAVARAAVMIDAARATAAVDETRKLAPDHVMAKVLGARLAFVATRDASAALAVLDPIQNGPARARLAREELAEFLATRAMALFARGSVTEARAAYDEALKLDNRCLLALLGQAEMLHAEGRFTEALARYDAAVQLEPLHVQALVGRAKAKIALERLADAKAELTAARDRLPDSPAILYWLATAESALGNKGAAEKLMLAAIDKVDPKNQDAVLPYVGLSKLLSSAGRAAEAEAKLADAQKKLPDSPLLQRALGDVAAEQTKFDQAIGHYRAALAKDPNDLASRFRLGVTLRRKGKLDDAAAELDKVASVDKEYPGVALERGLLYEASGSVDKALESFRTALKAAPNDPDLQLRVGASLVIVQRPDEAIVELKKVLEQRPTSAEAHHYLGRANMLKGGASEADGLRELKRAVELDPNRAEYHLYVGWAANDAIPWQAGLARDEIEKALALDKNLAEAHWQRGVIALRQRAVEDAARDLKHALAQKPGLLEVYASIAELHEVKNDPKGALVAWAKAMGATRVRPLWHYQYGKLLFETNKAGEAAKQLALANEQAQAADDRSPWTVKCRFYLAEAYRKTGQKEAAAEQYRAFLEVAPSNAPERSEAMAALTALSGGRR